MGNKLELGDYSQELLQIAYRKFEYQKPDNYEWLQIIERLRQSKRIGMLGDQFLVDCRELPLFRAESMVKVASSLYDTKANIELKLNESHGLAGYITGGLEGLHLQMILNGLEIDGINPLIMGVEEDSYVRKKGREPLFTTQEKLALWEKLAPDNSLIFVIPLRPDHINPDIYYDFISDYLGLFKNKRVIYLGATDDPPEVKSAHLRRAASPKHCLNFSMGQPPIHTSQLLIK